MSALETPSWKPGLCAAVVLLALALAGPATAQNNTTRVLLERIASLEQSVRDLERLVYRGGAAPAGGAGAPTQAAELEVRLMQLDQAVRGLTGQVEESEHANRQLQQRIDEMAAEFDKRLGALERTVAELQRGPAPAGMAAADAATPQPVTPTQPSQGYSATAPAPAQQAAVAAPPAPVGGILPPGTPDEQYKFATGLVRQRSFADAERAFREFLALHPDDELAPNAQYWLGETLYVRQMYEDAARTFLAGYQRYPDSSKATDSLLKLGVTLNRLGQNNEACATFDELLRRLPANERRLRPKAEFERQNSGCK